MTQQPNQRPISLIVTITKYLPTVEKILLTALIIGTILRIMHIDSSVTQVTLVGLGIIFFLFAYRPTELQRNEGEQFEFFDLLAVTIVPKVLWISSAVSVMGLAFYLFDLGNDSYKRLLTIGAISIGSGVTILILAFTKGVRHLNTVTPVLLRAVPLLLADFYILFR